MNEGFVSKRPYLVPAYYHWIVASGMKPHLVVDVDYPGVMVPNGFDEDSKIVLNVDPDAVRDFQIDSQWIVFDAIFDVDPVTVRVPMGAVALMFVPETQWFVDFSDDIEPGSSGVDTKYASSQTKKPAFRILRHDAELNESSE